MTGISKNPRSIIDQAPMTAMQKVIVALTVLYTAVDGFDVLSNSVSGSGIMSEFGLDRAGLGMVLSMELIGMALGSIFLGGLADKLGRRNMLLFCLVIMTSGMWLVAHVTDIRMLCLWRVYTGVSIGGLLSATNAVVAEFSNKKRRGLCISLMVIGYPFGGIVCGAAGGMLLETGAVNWREMFILGAVFTALMIPLTYFLLPESIDWLTRTRAKNALVRVNVTLRKIGHSKVDKLDFHHEEKAVGSLLDIFSGPLILATLLLTLAYSCQMLTFYYILKWTPTIVVQMGIGAASAAGVLFWVNVGGVTGGLIFGLLTSRIGLKPLTISILILTSAAVCLFGQAPAELTTLSLLATMVGFFANAGVSGIYTLVAYVFPTHVRATGTGFVIGVGRAGAIIAPWAAGILMQQGLDRGETLANVLSTVAIVMALGSLVAGLALVFVNYGKDTATKAESGTLTNNLLANEE